MKLLQKIEMMLMFIHIALIFKRDSAANHYTTVKVGVHISPFRKQYERFGKHTMLAPVVIVRDANGKLERVSVCINTAYHHMDKNLQLTEILVNDINRRIDNDILSLDKVV